MAASVAAPITPSVLTWARQEAAVTVPELAKRVKVEPQRVLDWESGKSFPTVAMLRAIADLLRQPMALFFAPEPPARSSQAPPDFRATGSVTGRVLTREIRLAGERRDTFKQLAPELVAESAWPQWRRAGDMNAAEVRERLGVSTAAVATTRSVNEALRLWIAAVEDQGVLIFQMSRIGDDVCSGFCMDDATTPVIVLNGKEAPARRIFTLMHEFCHLLNRSGGLCLLDEDIDKERECNRFAENVLMPVPAVRSAVADVTGVGAVDIVERRFRVSRVAAAVALRRRGIVGQQVVDDEAKRSDEARAQAADRDVVIRPELLKRRNLGDVYLSTVLDAMDAETISVADATYFLGAKVGMIGRLEHELAGATR